MVGASLSEPHTSGLHCACVKDGDLTFTVKESQIIILIISHQSSAHAYFNWTCVDETCVVNFGVHCCSIWGTNNNPVCVCVCVRVCVCVWGGGKLYIKCFEEN